MPRIRIPTDKIGATGEGVAGNGFASMTGVIADPTNDHEFVNSGNEILILQNFTPTTPATQQATVVSVLDASSRFGDIVITCPINTLLQDSLAIAGPFLKTNWNQGGGTLINVDTAALATNLKFYVFQVGLKR